VGDGNSIDAHSRLNLTTVSKVANGGNSSLNNGSSMNSNGGMPGQ